MKYSVSFNNSGIVLFLIFGIYLTFGWAVIRHFNLESTACAATGNENPTADESAKANKFFEKASAEFLMRKPMLQSYLGIKTDYDKWDDLSEKASKEEFELIKSQLDTFYKDIDYSKLDDQTKVSYDVFADNAHQQIDMYQYRHYDYPVNQISGFQSMIPAFLMSVHLITSVEDAKDYISRLRKMPDLFRQLIENLKIRAGKGIIAPKFVFPYVLSDCKNVLTGAPFDTSGTDSALLADFKAKVNNLQISGIEKSNLIAEAVKALFDSVKPAYQALTDYLAELEKQAPENGGAWSLPKGADFYDHALKGMTTTDLSSEKIYEIGVSEVSRLHERISAIMKEVGFDGTIQEFFTFMRENKEFYYDNTEEGKNAYLNRAIEVIETMKDHLDELFITKPKSDLVVKPVEPFREESTEQAFYQPPSLDGSRPGIFYINLSRVPQMPIYELEALAYHEGIPGHHMQLAILTEMEGMPTFRKVISYSAYTAYLEGWALYAERLPKEIGFYKDTYSDFGRISFELWRACRLVTDTGLHAQKWSREQAVNYLMENTAITKDGAISAVERYIVLPAQATSYTIGMLKILELREKAGTDLGEGFDLREFHDTVLRNGPVPLILLEKIIDAWVAKEKE